MVQRMGSCSGFAGKMIFNPYLRLYVICSNLEYVVSCHTKMVHEFTLRIIIKVPKLTLNIFYRTLYIFQTAEMCAFEQQLYCMQWYNSASLHISELEVKLIEELHGQVTNATTTYQLSLSHSHLSPGKQT